MPNLHTLVLMRHGESTWNLANRFTGWEDVDLTEKGIEQARLAGQLLKDAALSFDVAYTSVLKRAIRTLWCTLDEMDLMWLPVKNDWRLNERHYGALQGLDKGETAATYGIEQVNIWRRSYDIPPAPLAPNDPRLAYADRRYAHLDPQSLPLTECLKDTVARVLPCWHHDIAPAIRRGERVLISAHGNSLRALMKILEGIDDEAIVHVNVPNGQPLVVQLDQDLKVVGRTYLGDPAVIDAAMKALAGVASPHV